MGRRAGESRRSPGRTNEVPQGKEVLAGNVGQIRQTGSPRHSTEAWACTSHQSPRPTFQGTSGASAGPCTPPAPGSSWAAQCCLPSAHSLPTRQTQHSKKPYLGTAKLWFFSINLCMLHGHHSLIAPTEALPITLLPYD